MVEITKSVHVSAPWLDSAGVHLFTKSVDGVDFVKLLKTDPRLHRLIVGRAWGKSKSLNMSIFDDWCTARTAARAQMLKDIAQANNPCADDLDLDSSHDMSHLLPSTMSIDLQGVGEVKFLIIRSHYPIRVELTADVVNFLHESAMKGDEPTEPIKRKTLPPDHVQKPYYDKARKSFRVRHGSKMKDFKCTSDSDAARAVALEKANAFYESFQ